MGSHGLNCPHLAYRMFTDGQKQWRASTNSIGCCKVTYNSSLKVVPASMGARTKGVDV